MDELDAEIEAYIREAGATPSFKGYLGFPKSTCISVNEEVVHGIPGNRQLRAGDIVGLDVGAIWRGYHADAARTFAVGEVEEEAKRLMRVTRESLEPANSLLVGEIDYLPLGKVELAVGVNAAPGLKVRVSGGFNMPGVPALGATVVYLVGAR